MFHYVWTEATLLHANHKLATKTGWTDYQRVLKGAAEVWKKVFWPDETKMNLKGSAQHPKHSSSSVK